MDARNVKHVVATLGAMFLSAAPAGYAAMFKWTDAEGTVTYSNQPPADSAKVRHVAQLDIATGGTESQGANATHSLPEPSLSRPDTWLKGTSPPPPRVERNPTLESNPSAKVEVEPSLRDTDVANHEAQSAPRAPLRGAREAARDPCLRSSDPKCYERNKERYHPYLGYTPGVMSGSTPAVGSTGTNGAGGAVGGHVANPSANAAPRRVETPLIFLDQPAQKKRSSRWPFGQSR
jgi:hypothetical protein